MAKSLRSKRKRRMRNVKRVRYAKRELTSLKKIVEEGKISASKGENELYTVLTKDELEKLKKEQDEKAKLEGSMETDQAKKYDKKTKQDENGQYPLWMNQRAIQKLRSQKKGKPKRGKKKIKPTPDW